MSRAPAIIRDLTRFHINNILPKADQFYNKYIEIPDYDFLSGMIPIRAQQQATAVEAVKGVRT